MNAKKILIISNEQNWNEPRKKKSFILLKLQKINN